MPLPTEAREGCWGCSVALWVRPVHASWKVELTADATSTTTLPSTVTAMFVVSERHCEPLSAAVNNPIVCGAQGGTIGSMLRSAAATNIAFPPLA